MANLLLYSKTLARSSSASILCRALRDRGHEVLRATPTTRPTDRAVGQMMDNGSGRIDVGLSYGVSALPREYMLSSYVPDDTFWLNSPSAVGWNAHKVQMFERLARSNIPHLDWTSNRAVAQDWLDYGEVVYARRLVQAHSGKGIRIVGRTLDPVPGKIQNVLPNCNLYTKAWPDNNTIWGRIREYRVYISGEIAVGLTEKRRYGRERLAEAGIDRDCFYNRAVRTNANGWVFAHSDMRCSREQAAVIMGVGEVTANAMRLGVGAVDVIVSYTRDYTTLRDIRVIETNTSISLRDAPTTTNLIVNGVHNFLQEWDEESEGDEAEW